MLKSDAQKLFLILTVALVFPACSPKGAILWWQNLQSKSGQILTAEIRYEELEKAHAELREEHYELEHRYLSLLAEVESKRQGEERLKNTGSKDGRTPAEINYQVPADMDAEARNLLAYQHVKAGRFPQAAKTFDSFLWAPEGAAFQTAKNFYEAGVAWYQVRNYKKAKSCFQAVLQHADAVERTEFERRVDLWMRVLDQRLPASTH